ncbi:hypothetical protein KY284_026317 [Solanum tuberosum]|nr:hypothetical protein KY284_026317 [Solanum tuberosum]
MMDQEKDVPSNLPDDVIDEILMCLPFRDAFCTNTFSDIIEIQGRYRNYLLENVAELSLQHYRKDWKKCPFYRPIKLPVDMLCVKSLCMCIRLDTNGILSALCLIRSFPFLQYMEIQMKFNVDHTTPVLDCLEVEAFQNVEFQHLTVVKLKDVNDSMQEMQLTKLLLAQSPKLVRMSINPQILLEESRILNRIVEFKRALRKAKVVFIHV